MAIGRRLLGFRPDRIRELEFEHNAVLLANKILIDRDAVWTARIRELEALVHRAHSQFENITAAESFKDALDMAHNGVAFDV